MARLLAISAPGSLTYLILRTLLKEAGVDDAKLVAVGPAASGYPQVIDAQLAASWSSPPANVNYLLAGEIRIIARANNSPQVHNETTRVNAVNANFLASHRGEVIGFLKAYKKSVDWAYSSPLALNAYAQLSGQSLDVAKYIFKEFTSRDGAQIDQIKGENRVLAEALAAKRIPHALTHEDIEGDLRLCCEIRATPNAGWLTNCCVALWSLLALFDRRGVSPVWSLSGEERTSA